MYKEANIVDLDKVISLIRIGRVSVRHIDGGQVYDVYGTINDKKPIVSFTNNWAEGVFLLSLNGTPADGFDYRSNSISMPEYKNLLRVMEACIERCRKQDNIVLSGNGVSVSKNGNNVTEYRQNIFAKFIQKMCAGNAK